MGSQLEGFIGMMCVAVVGGVVVAIVSATESPMALTAFAYVGTHFLAVGILTVPCAIVSVWLEHDPSPRLHFIWSMLLVFVFPAIISLTLTIGYYWPDPTSGLTRTASFVGAGVFPFLVLGIGGTAIESLMTRKKGDRTKR